MGYALTPTLSQRARGPASIDRAVQWVVAAVATLLVVVPLAPIVYQSVLDRPLCERVPGVSPPGTTQYWAKAYPGLRELQVLKDFGERTENSIVASICALEVTDAASPNYGYRPAMDAIVTRMRDRLSVPSAP